MLCLDLNGLHSINNPSAFDSEPKTDPCNSILIAFDTVRGLEWKAGSRKASSTDIFSKVISYKHVHANLSRRKKRLLFFFPGEHSAKRILFSDRIKQFTTG